VILILAKTTVRVKMTDMTSHVRARMDTMDIDAKTNQVHVTATHVTTAELVPPTAKDTHVNVH